MDYRRVRNDAADSKQEKLKNRLILVLACIIAVQTITVITLSAAFLHQRAMYLEALGAEIKMQEEINRLKDGQTPKSEDGDVGKNYDIPFVTEGREIEDESSIGD